MLRRCTECMSLHMSTLMCTHGYALVHACLYTCLRTCPPTCLHICTAHKSNAHAHTCLRTYTCTYTCLHTCLYTCPYTCPYAGTQWIASLLLCASRTRVSSSKRSFAYAFWPMPSGLCLLAYAFWPMPYCLCLIAYAFWPMPSGLCLSASWSRRFHGIKTFLGKSLSFEIMNFSNDNRRSFIRF